MGEVDGYERAVMSAEALNYCRGIGIGVAVAAPVGPMSLLCMRRTLVQGWRFGFGTGAGIAVGDALYAFVAALGLAGTMRFLVRYERPLHLAAGFVLVFMATRTLVSSKAPVQSPQTHVSIGFAFLSSLLLTLTNPPTIASFIAIFAALGPADFDGSAALTMVSGVFSGSLCWWLAMTSLVAAARHALGPRAQRWIDRCSAAALGMLGATELRRAM